MWFQKDMLMLCLQNGVHKTKNKKFFNPDVMVNRS